MRSHAVVKNVSVKMADEKVAKLDEDAEESGMSRAEYIRSTLESRHDSGEAQTELDRLRSELEDKEREIERLNRERRQILEQREEHTELVAAVQSEKTLAERKAQAGLGTRIKWWFTGMDDDS